MTPPVEPAVRKVSRLPLIIGVTTVLLLAVRCWLAARAELLPEEAYYWTYWKHPALSYFDHPPMVAWVIGAGTRVFGDTEIGVRLGFILLSLGSAYLLHRITRLWFGKSAARVATWLFLLLPAFVAAGLLAFPDGPLVFFWLLTLHAFSRALTTNRPGLWWAVTGLAWGGAMLSKYTAALLGVSALVFLAVSPAHRPWLKRPHPWLALFLAAAAFSPVILWNARHEWASFLFQSARTAGAENYRWTEALRAWLTQAGILTPPVAVALVAAMRRGLQRGWRDRDDAWNFALSFSVPAGAVFVLASFRTELHTNWLLPAYLSLLPAVAARYLEITPRGRQWIGAVTIGLCLLVTLVAFSGVLWGVPSSLTYRHAGGWRALAERVTKETAALTAQTGRQPFVLGADKYNLAAELGFYTGQPAQQLNTLALGAHGLGYRYWTDLRAFAGRPAVVVLRRTNDTSLARLNAHFDRLDPPVPIRIPTLGARHRELFLVNAHGYRVEPHP